MYLNGFGVKQNNERAKYWLEQAANQGLTIAITDLASFREKKENYFKQFTSKKLYFNNNSLK